MEPCVEAGATAAAGPRELASACDVGAERGTLTVIIGGDAGLVERCRPIFDARDSDVFHVGAMGTGEAAKLGNDMMTHCNHLVALEAMKLAAAYGTTRRRWPRWARRAPAGAGTSRTGVLRPVHGGAHPRGDRDLFFMRQSSKDAVHAAEAEEVPVPITGLCTELRPTLPADRYDELREREG